MAVVHGAMRRGEDELEDADRITAGDMLRSLDLHEALLAKRQAAASRLPSRSSETQPHAADEEPRRRKRGRPPRTSRR